MDKLRATRDKLEKGDTVMVNYPGGLEGHKKPRRGRVVEVMRAAVRLTFDDDHVERVVQFKYISKYEEVEDVPPPPKVASILHIQPKALQSPPEPAQPDDVQAWLDMGATLITQLEEKIAAADLSAAALEADSKALLAEAEREKHLAASLKDKLSKLKNIAGRR
jgi:hypothetical protein